MPLDACRTTRRYRSWARALAVVATLLIASAAPAQLQTGNLYGRVVDEQGVALPGVSVTLSGHGADQLQVTNSKGRFRFPGLGPGSYSLKAELEGFSTLQYPNIVISVGRNTPIRMTLAPMAEDIVRGPR